MLGNPVAKFYMTQISENIITSKILKAL